MIQREHTFQVRLRKWVREAVATDHEFMAFDRSQASGQFTHDRERSRGLRKGTPDTLLLVKGFAPIFCELKAKGEVVKPGSAQDEMGLALMAVGCWWSWCDRVQTYCAWLQTIGVPLRANAEFLALHADGSTDTLIAKAEAKAGKAPKSYKPRAAKPTAARLRRGEAVRRAVLF